MKIFFTRPKKTNVLIYDRHSLPFAKKLFKLKSFTTYDVRYESINLYVFIKTLFVFGLRNFSLEYKRNFFKLVEPKIIYTSIDNNVGFYKLKNLYPKAIYIADQNGLRDNTFYKNCLNESKHINLQCDFFFVFGNYEKKRLSKVIKSNFIPCGNTLNNSYFNIKKNKKKKIITYIASNIIKYPNLEKKIFFNLIKFCRIHNFKLFYLDRAKWNKKKLLYDFFTKKGWTHIIPKNPQEKFSLLNKSRLIFFSHSTLGHECLSRGFKCISLDYNKFNEPIKQKEGLYWCKPSNFNVLNKKALKVLDLSKKEWKLGIKKNVEKVLIYCKGNKIKKKIIDNILKNTKKKFELI